MWIFSKRHVLFFLIISDWICTGKIIFLCIFGKMSVQHIQNTMLNTIMLLLSRQLISYADIERQHIAFNRNQNLYIVTSMYLNYNNIAIKDQQKQTRSIFVLARSIRLPETTILANHMNCQLQKQTSWTMMTTLYLCRDAYLFVLLRLVSF